MGSIAVITVSFFTTSDILLNINITKINQNNHLQDNVSSISDVGSVDDPGLNAAIAL